jgi:ubiquitin thioesterase protein OTUB1
MASQISTGATDVSATDTTPRVIDEHTDMSTLTDQEIMKLMEGMGQEDVSNKVP